MPYNKKQLAFLNGSVKRIQKVFSGLYDLDKENIALLNIRRHLIEVAKGLSDFITKESEVPNV